ncbi:MAG: hypothetical protein Q9219_006027 [cf. Caloplaca sp. 3 TL-2023]
MYLSTTLLSTLTLAGGALAQYGSSNYGSGPGGSSSGASMASGDTSTMSASAGAPTPSGDVKVHVVKVSNKQGSLTFEPNNLQAAAGSMVQFHFYPKNHSVVQSTFDQPCQPIKNNMPSVNGFFSGFMPVAPNAAMMPSYTIMINDTKPIWYYCSRADHCQDGMVGVINPPAANQSRTIESFTTLAKQATANLSPGQSASTASSAGSDSSSSSSSGTGSYGSGSGSYGPGSAGSYGSSGSDSSGSSAAAAPAPSSNTPGSSVTMPLAGTNSSMTTTGAATPSGSGGGQSPAAFVPGSDANAFASRLRIFSSLGLAGVVSFLAASLW